jgi:hypothetical protein
MKKLNYLLSLLLVVGMAFTFTSCDDTEAVGPTIDLFGGDYIDANTTVTAGATMMFKMNATAGDKNLAEFYVTKDGTNLSGYPLEISGDTYQEVVEIEAPLNEGSYVYGFKVVDKDDLYDEVTVTITVEAASGPISTYSAKLMGAQSHATLGSFLDAETGTVYLLAAARTNASAVDVFYYYGSSNQASFAALDDTDANEFSIINSTEWTTRNSTKFVTTSITPAEFIAMENDAEFVDASASSVTQLAVGDVVGFKTVGGKMGLIHVASIDGAADGSITIDIKVQQ